MRDTLSPILATTDERLRVVAGRCKVTARAASGLAGCEEGDAWPFAPERVSAPAGSDGWWWFAGDVLAVAHNTGVISMDERNDLLNLAYETWCAAQGRQA